MSTKESELKLKRFLYLCSESPKYTALIKNAYPFSQLNQVQSLFELQEIQTENKIKPILESVNTNALCNREALIYALAVYMRGLNAHDYGNLFNVIVQSPKELFLLVKFAQKIKKNFAYGLRRVISDYYLKLDLDKLVDVLINHNGCYGWSHKDVFKLAHLKPKNKAQEFLTTYIVRGLDEAKEKFKDISFEGDSKKMEKIIKKLENLDKLKHCQNAEEAVALFNKWHFQLQKFPAHLLKSQIVWDALIPKLDIPTMLSKLGTLNKLGFLKNNTSTLNKVVEVMSDAKKCQTSKMQPAQVLIHMKTFERGKPLDPKKKSYINSLELLKIADLVITPVPKPTTTTTTTTIHPKNVAISNAFQKLLQHSYRNVRSTGRHIMITLDVRDKFMKKMCFETKTVTCMEAAVTIAMSYLKAEKEVTVAVFRGTGVTIVPLDKAATYSQVEENLKKAQNDFVVLSSPCIWAIENKKPIDVFINLLHSYDRFQRTSKIPREQQDIIAVLKRYRKTMRVSNAKMITVTLGSRSLSVADGSAHILDVCGFDQNVPKVIEAYCRGIFH